MLPKESIEDDYAITGTCGLFSRQSDIVRALECCRNASEFQSARAKCIVSIN